LCAFQKHLRRQLEHARRPRIGIPMLGELTKLPIDTLLDIVFVVLAGGQRLTLSEVGELEQIQLKLQRRGELEGARLCQMAMRLKDL